MASTKPEASVVGMSGEKRTVDVLAAATLLIDASQPMAQTTGSTFTPAMS